MKIKLYNFGNDCADAIVNGAITFCLTLAVMKYGDSFVVSAMLLSAMMTAYKVIEIGIDFIDGKYYTSQNYEHILAIKPLSRFIGYIFDASGSKVEVIRIPYDNSIKDRTIYMEYSVIEGDE